MANEYLGMGELGKQFGMTSHQVGRVLAELGYRQRRDGKLRPSERAFDEGLVAQRWGDVRPEVYNWVWHRDKTAALLEAAGWKRVDDGE